MRRNRKWKVVRGEGNEGWKKRMNKERRMR